MTTTTPAAGDRIYLENIRWPTYIALLEDLGAQRGRSTFDHGRVEIVSPSKKQERLTRLLSRLIDVFTEELGIQILGVRSTTLQREDLQRGVEADECYYVSNASVVHGREDLDLARDPPPDLVVEVEVTQRILARLPIFAAMGVREVWRYDGELLRVCRLGEDGDYHEIESSEVFPQLPIADLMRFLAEGAKASETDLVRSFRRWTRERFELD